MKLRIRISLLFCTIAAAIISLNTACTEQREVLLSSVDIPATWMPTDTVYIPLEVLPAGTIREGLMPDVPYIVEHTPYLLLISLRHEHLFRHHSLCLWLEIQFTDSNARTYYTHREKIEIPLIETEDKDAIGHNIRWRGDSWGSLISLNDVCRLPIDFPYHGDYRIALYPGYPSDEEISGLNSLSFSLLLRE